jgi:hypothetical protein
MRIIFYWTLLTLTCGYALVRGRRDERVAAMVCIVASLAMPLVLGPFAERYVSVELGAVLVDLGVLAAFVTIALQSERFWPLWIAGLQLTTMLSHVLKTIHLGLMPWAYGAAEHFWSYPILLIIAIGAWRARARWNRDQQALV